MIKHALFTIAAAAALLASPTAATAAGAKPTVPAPAADSITPAQVRLRFDQARQAGVHPRLFFAAADIQRIKTLRQQRDPFVLMAFEQMQQEADATLKEPLLDYALDDAKLRIPAIHRFAGQLPKLVLMYQLTGEKKYADRCWAQLEKQAHYPDWGADRHFLDTGIGAFSFALAYDGLHDYLMEAQRAELRAGVLRHALQPGQQQMERNAWWHKANHNWNGICHGGLLMAALAMFEADPANMSQVVSLAANALPLYLREFEPDGQSEEGLMYWSYGLMYTTVALEAMERALGTSFGLADRPGLRKAGWFPIYMSGPAVGLSIGDDPLKNSRGATFFWFARHYHDAPLAKAQYELALENKAPVWHDILYYDPALVKAATTGKKVSLDNHIRKIEVMSLRENWTKDALYIALHGGNNNANHGHLDAGTFDIQALGETWAYGALGSDNYTYPGYFSKTTQPAYTDAPAAQAEAGRWHFYRLRAEGKNCLAFNPGTRPDQDPMGAATLLDSGSSEQKSFFVVDLSSPYKRDVTSYHRGILLDRTRRTITVQDELKARQGADIWWSMHTKAAIEVTENGRGAILRLGDKKMGARIVSPGPASFQVLAATYLPGEAFPLTKNSPNAGFRKLAIELKGVDAANIRVEFYPITPGATAKPKKPTGFQPMASW
ncbi:hypothetical protein [Hymenobacter armeniacus]|uniref:DUF4962 domain-containing protein n=1 Tax=Hymenobacter armeniacus TaxID=2771358 RepID=A0ABR8JVH9_9BACT|nr:hypothetical protein [Hymenobacter armeniacus]MBD2723110.1 hypothetical protein [Hymenobacter armeniacus]